MSHPFSYYLISYHVTLSHFISSHLIHPSYLILSLGILSIPLSCALIYSFLSSIFIYLFLSPPYPHSTSSISSYLVSSYLFLSLLVSSIRFSLCSVLSHSFSFILLFSQNLFPFLTCFDNIREWFHIIL